MSRELAPHTKSILGVDISQGMVDQYNKRVENQGISPEEMRAIAVELKGESEDELDGAKFDIIVVRDSFSFDCTPDGIPNESKDSAHRLTITSRPSKTLLKPSRSS